MGTLNGHKDSVESLDISQKFDYYASGSLDGTIKIWDQSSMKIRDTLTHEDGVIKVMFSKNSHLLYSCSRDTTVCVWDIRTGKNVRQLFGHDNTVNDFDVSNDENFIVSCGDDSKTLIFSLLSTNSTLIENNHDNNKIESKDDKYINELIN